MLSLGFERAYAQAVAVEAPNLQLNPEFEVCWGHYCEQFMPAMLESIN